MSNCVFGAMTFGSKQPWNTLLEDELFAFDPADGGPRVYGSVLGGGGEVFRLMVYEGDDGYRFFHRLHTGSRIEHTDFYTSANTMYVDYVPARELKPPDKALLRAFGLNPRGAGLWPMFRAIRRGSVEWYVSEREAVILADCLLIGLVAEGESRTKPDLDLWEDPNKLPLIRVEFQEGERATPHIEMVPAPAVRAVPTPLAPPPLDRQRIEQLKRKASGKVAGAWELDRFTLDSLIGRNNERPRLSAITMAADAASGFIFPPSMTEYADDTGEALYGALLGAIESLGAIPAKLHVGKTTFKDCLAPLTAELGIPVEVKKALPAIAACRRAMKERPPF